MPSSLLIVGILTVGFTLASFFAYIMQRIRLPAILGYLLAGYLIGPYSPGFVADIKIAEQLAEVGVILMLFGVGLHFKVEDLIRVKNVAIPGAIIQTLAATLFATLLLYSMNWTLESGIIIGLSIGVASTVVLVRILFDNKILNTLKGDIAVGWLVVEDIFTVIVLILLPTLAAFSAGSEISYAMTFGLILVVLVKFSILALFMFTWGHKIIDYILTSVARVRSQELFTLTILALVFLIATGSSIVFGTSIALGAFIAGMLVGKTNVRHQAAANALPLKDIFAVIFFLSVGMLFNPEVMITHFTLFIGILSIVLLVKPLVAYLLIMTAGYSLNVALTVAFSLAQIGEFSFILAEEAMNLDLIPDEGFDILVACALISIPLNSLLFQVIGSFEAFLNKWLSKFSKRSLLNKSESASKSPSKVVIIGFGPIGKAVTKIVKELGFLPIIVEENIDTVSNMEEEYSIIFGDALDANILKDAEVETASHLLITLPDSKKAVMIVRAARHVNPNIQIIARAQYVADQELFEELNIQYICTEIEASKAFSSLTHQVLQPVCVYNSP